MIKTCKKCKRIINQKFITVQGQPFHPECFVCSECKKKINGSFNVKGLEYFHEDCYKKKFRMYCAKCRKDLGEKWIVSNGLKYHESCYENFVQPKCGICNKPIDGEYTKDESGNYHTECYKAEKALRCDICNQIIEGEYIVDNWDNKSHKKHNGVSPEFCDCCSRIISEKTSKGATKYKDNRKICGICQETEIIEIHQTVPSKLKVIEQLNAVGFKYIPAMLKVELMDKVSINKLLGTSITNNTHGCTRTSVKSQNGKLIGKEHNIGMLYGLPKLQFEGVLAHELLHVWLNEKNIDMPDHETEGFCNLGAALIYSNDKSKFAEILLKQLEKDTDKVYGDGYRIMAQRLKEIGWEKLIDEVSNFKPKLVKAPVRKPIIPPRKLF